MSDTSDIKAAIDALRLDMVDRMARQEGSLKTMHDELSRLRADNEDHRDRLVELERERGLARKALDSVGELEERALSEFASVGRQLGQLAENDIRQNTALERQDEVLDKQTEFLASIKGGITAIKWMLGGVAIAVPALWFLFQHLR